LTLTLNILTRSGVETGVVKWTLTNLLSERARVSVGWRQHRAPYHRKFENARTRMECRYIHILKFAVMYEDRFEVNH